MFTFYICFSVCPDLGPRVVELLHFQNWFCFHFPAEFEILFQWVFPIFSGIPRAGCLPSGNAFPLHFLSLFPMACWDEAQLCGPRQCQGSTDPVPGTPGRILHLWFLLYSAELPWCWDGEGATAWPFPWLSCGQSRQLHGHSIDDGTLFFIFLYWAEEMVWNEEK